MPRLTDKQRKQIIADYVELGSWKPQGKSSKKHLEGLAEKAI